MSKLEELEARGFLKRRDLVKKVAEATGRPHGENLVGNVLSAPMHRFRVDFAGDGLIVNPEDWASPSLAVYDELLLYFWAAYVELYPPLTRRTGIKKPPTAFELAEFKRAFMSNEASATKHIPEPLKPGYRRLIKNRRRSMTLQLVKSA